MCFNYDMFVLIISYEIVIHNVSINVYSFSKEHYLINKLNNLKQCSQYTES